MNSTTLVMPFSKCSTSCSLNQQTVNVSFKSWGKICILLQNCSSQYRFFRESEINQSTINDSQLSLQPKKNDVPSQVDRSDRQFNKEFPLKATENYRYSPIFSLFSFPLFQKNAFCGCETRTQGTPCRFFDTAIKPLIQ